MLLVILIILAATLFIISGICDAKDPYGMGSVYTAFTGAFPAAVAIVLIIIGCVSHFSANAEVAKNQQRYESLVYQAENNLYDNDNDLGKKELVNQIQKWNEDLAHHKEIQDNFWVGFMYPNIYDQFEFIPLELVK